MCACASTAHLLSVMVDEEEGCGKILKKMNINCYSFILIVLLCEPLPIERSARILKIKAMSINPPIGLVVFGL